MNIKGSVPYMFVCPICHHESEFQNGIFQCSNCKFKMKDTISNHQLSDSELFEISTNGYTQEIKNFISKVGKKYSGIILALPKCCTLLFKAKTKNNCAVCNASSNHIYENNQILWCTNCKNLHFKSKPNFGLQSDCFYPFKQSSQINKINNAQLLNVEPSNEINIIDQTDMDNINDIEIVYEENEHTYPTIIAEQPDYEYYDIFISHSSADNAKVYKIYNFLIANGFRCWLDKSCIPAGNTYTSEIGKGLQSSALFLCIMSKNANASKPVRDEAIAAYNNKKPMLVYSIDPDINVANLHHEISLQYGGTQWICNYGKDDRKEALNKLVDAVERLLEENQETVEQLKASKLQGKQQSPIKPNIKPTIRRFLINLTVMLSILVTSFFLWDYLRVSGILNTGANDPKINKTLLANKSRKLNEKETISDISGLKIGTVLQMGSYLEEPINWVYVFDDIDGNQVFLSQQAITFKPFDNAHNGTYGKISNGSIVEMIPSRKDTVASFSKKITKADWIRAFGENSWEHSSIRAWLNSNEITVKYPSVKPSIENINAESARLFGMTYLKRLDEPGFLKCFTENELSLLKSSKNMTILTDNQKKSAILGTKLFDYFEGIYDNRDLYKQTMIPRIKPFIFDFEDVLKGATEDLVILPSLEEFIKISKNANIKLDYSKMVYASNGEGFWLPNMTWILRTPCGFLNTTICSVVGSNVNEGQVALLLSNVSDFSAIRPMIRLSVKELELIGDGTTDSPLLINQ